jgi:transposase-like protein
MPPHPRPTRRRCAFPDCPSLSDPRAGGIVRHGRMRSRTGSRTRFLCRACGRTFCGRRGSAYYRLQTPRRTFDRFAELLSEGLSCAAIARLLDVAPGTISRWLARASKHAHEFADSFDRITPKEMQFDEISARPANHPGSPWIFNGIEVSTRYWAAAVVGRRSRRATRALVLQARQACKDLSKRVLITSDPFPYYENELRRGRPTTARTRFGTPLRGSCSEPRNGCGITSGSRRTQSGRTRPSSSA